MGEWRKFVEFSTLLFLFLAFGFGFWEAKERKRGVDGIG